MRVVITTPPVRALRMVDPLEWDLTGSLPEDRLRRLEAAPHPDDILSAVAAEAIVGYVHWQPGNEMVGCRRARTEITLTPKTFDALMNGRSGYRAQYYLSCSEGADFNRRVITELLHSAESALTEDLDRDAKLKSLRGPWSKIWFAGDSKSFKGAPMLRPRRWFERNPVMVWHRAPLPIPSSIELIGTWMDAEDNYQQDPSKADRDCWLHKTGSA